MRRNHILSLSLQVPTTTTTALSPPPETRLIHVLEDKLARGLITKEEFNHMKGVQARTVLEDKLADGQISQAEYDHMKRITMIGESCL